MPTVPQPTPNNFPVAFRAAGVLAAFLQNEMLEKMEYVNAPGGG